jgi:hypothetical protein
VHIHGGAWRGWTLPVAAWPRALAACGCCGLWQVSSGDDGDWIGVPRSPGADPHPWRLTRRPSLEASVEEVRLVVEEGVRGVHARQPRWHSVEHVAGDSVAGVEDDFGPVTG